MWCSPARARLVLLSSLVAGLALAACGDDPPAIIDARPIDAPSIDGETVDLRPGPVTNFAAANVATGLSLSWTNPPDTDLAGILVVAGAGVPILFTPTDGTTYTAGMTVGPGQAVIATSLATAVPSFQAIAAIDFAFSAWAVDQAGQYSLVATTSGRTDVLGVQQGVIQLFQDGTVVVTQQPPALLLSGTVSYDAKGGTMTAQLAVENRTGRVLFNLKGLVDTASQGTVDNPTFPAVGGLPMAYYGPAGVAPTAAPARQLDLSGIDGSVDPVILTMHFVDAPAVIVQGSSGGPVETAHAGPGPSTNPGVGLVDSAGSGQRGATGVPDQLCARALPRGSALTHDARAVFTGAKSVPHVYRFDLTTLAPPQTTTLSTTSGLGAVGDVALTADGARLYAVLHDGNHFGGGAGTGGSCGGGKAKQRALDGRRHHRGRPAHAVADFGVLGLVIPFAHGGGPLGTLRLVELDAATLVELRRVALVGGGSRGELALVAGNRAVVTVQEGQAHVVDLTTMTEVDTDAATAGTQPLQLGGNAFQAIGVAPDGASFSIAIDDDANGYHLLTYTTATLQQTSDQPSTPVDFARVAGLSRGNNGRVLVLSTSATKGPSGGALEALDGTTVTPILAWNDGNAPDGLAVRQGRYYIPTREPAVRVYDAATNVELDTDGDPGNGVTPLGLDEPARRHGVLDVTPF